MTTTTGKLPVVSIVGRPNVGKSTLFNRLTGRKRAIVSSIPGTTRDVTEQVVKLDSGRAFLLRDTGGFLPEEGEIPEKVMKKLMESLSTSHFIILLVDGKEGLTPLDEELFKRVVELGIPFRVVVNKEDTTAFQENLYEFYRLSQDLITISAEHGTGIYELLKAIEEALPQAEAEEKEPYVKVAIVGRPNVGKSMLLNRILGYERVIVSDMPGTTRDPVDTLIERDGKMYLLVDTAGIRRKSRTEGFVEKVGIIKAIDTIKRCDVALLVVDASEGITDQDKKVAGMVQEEGKAIAVVANKWDLVDPSLSRSFDALVKEELSFLGDFPYATVSAKTGKRIGRIFNLVNEAYKNYTKRMSTSQVNRFFKKLLEEVPPPSIGKKPFRMYYATQVGTKPPTFVIFANTTELPENFRRFIINRLKKAFDFKGTPVRLLVRSTR